LNSIFFTPFIMLNDTILYSKNQMLQIYKIAVNLKQNILLQMYKFIL